jgi:Holliday junction resolvase RusA-like endonuclease
MTTICFKIPGPPKGKGRARFVKATGRAYTPADTASYENLVKVLAMQAMAGQPPLEGPVRVDLYASYPIAASWPKKKKADAAAGTWRCTVKPDIDNVLKAVWDAINGVVFKDDAQVVQVTAIKRFSETPGVAVFVKALP